MEWPAAWLEELVGKDRIKAGKRDGIKDQKLLNGIEAQLIVFPPEGSFGSN